MPRTKGAKNKRTIEQEIVARKQVEADIMEGKVTQAADRRVLAKDNLDKLATMLLGLTAHYQPHPQWNQVVDAAGNVRIVNANPYYDEGKFQFYIELAARTCDRLAAYQSPKLSAVAVGQVSKVQVTVVGGLGPRPEVGPAPPLTLPTS